MRAEKGHGKQSSSHTPGEPAQPPALLAAQPLIRWAHHLVSDHAASTATRLLAETSTHDLLLTTSDPLNISIQICLELSAFPGPVITGDTDLYRMYMQYAHDLHVSCTIAPLTRQGITQQEAS